MTARKSSGSHRREVGIHLRTGIISMTLACVDHSTRRKPKSIALVKDRVARIVSTSFLLSGRILRYSFPMRVGSKVGDWILARAPACVLRVAFEIALRQTLPQTLSQYIPRLLYLVLAISSYNCNFKQSKENWAQAVFLMCFYNPSLLLNTPPNQQNADHRYV